MRKLTENEILICGGLPTLIRDKKRYYIEDLWCKKCNKVPVGYALGMGPFFSRGYYCEECGNFITTIEKRKISKTTYYKYLKLLRR